MQIGYYSPRILTAREMLSKHPHVQPVAMILGGILILGAAIYAILLTIARVGDAHQREIEERIIESALGQHRMKLGGMMVQQAYWDAAYDAVGSRPDQHWLDANLGFSAELGSVPLTLVLDTQARAVYRHIGHAARANATELSSSPSLAMIAHRALLKPALPPAPVTAFVRAGNAVYLAAAERIVPNDARATLPLDRHYVLVYLLPVDEAMLRELQTGFGVARLVLSRAPNPQMAYVALTDTMGRPLGNLDWHAARPGRNFANEIAPIALGCFFLLAALQLIVLRWWMQIARRIQDEGVARTRFLANASHELRTPLNAIIGFSDCMVGEMFGPLSARYREYAGDIKTSGQLLLGIVNDVLDYTQLNSIGDIPMQPLKAGGALAGAVRMLREYAKDDDIHVDFIDRSNGAQVEASEKALCQILLNLGSNAVKFSPPGSTVIIVLQRRTECVELVVRDRGVGIPADKLPLVGQPFFQAHQASARRPGSGLGLAIVQKLTERLGGEFAIESVERVGTTVIVRLPLLRTPVEPDRIRAAA